MSDTLSSEPAQTSFATAAAPSTPPEGRRLRLPSILRPQLPPTVEDLLPGRVDLADPSVRLVAGRDERCLEELRRDDTSVIVSVARVNDIRRINRFFIGANRVLPLGGLLLVRFEELRQRRRRIMRRFPLPIAVPYYWATFLVHRILPKLGSTQRMYFALTRGCNRPLSRAEVLGRLVYCGFEILETRSRRGEIAVLARRSTDPRTEPNPSYGPLFAMPRVGQNGRQIRVFKLRTMHPYSEYLQAYVFERNRLAAGGKLRNDFRVTRWGRLFRRFWLDELPMLVNWFLGDLKLVGVRPLSQHYEGLYPATLRERRRRVRPGLVPPFYADLPGSFEEILASEARYLEAYERAPLGTDVRYLLRALSNIALKRARGR